MILCVGRGYVDEYINIVVRNYLSNNGRIALIKNLHFNGNILSVDDIDLKLPDNTRVHIKDLRVVFNLPAFSRLDLNITTSNVALVDNNNAHVISSKLRINYSVKLSSLSSEAITFFDQINSGNLTNASGVCTFKGVTLNNKEISCKLSDATASMEASSQITKSFGKISQLNAKLTLVNIPISLYHLVETFFPDNGVSTFLRDYIKSGNIVRGDLYLKLDEEFFTASKLSPDNLKGDFDINDLELRYDEYFPALKNSDLKVSVLGPLIKFIINKSYTSNTVISDGQVELNWVGFDNSKFIVTGNASGPVVDLTDFIPERALINAKSNSIDLRHMTGKADSKILIIIPLAPNTKNSFNISTEIQNAELSILRDNINCKKFKISGVFNGDEVILKGRGQINGMDSDFDYKYNFLDQSDYDHLLKVKSNIRDINNKKLGIVKLNDGNALFNFEYKSKNAKSVINAESNLKNLDFYINKISIHKPRGQNANITFNGDMKSVSEGVVKFKLKGENNLEISGDIHLGNNKLKAVFPVVKYNNTNISGEVEFGKDSLTTQIFGKSLDLSHADMMTFLEKDHDAHIENKLKVNIDKILLKNDVNLSDVKLNIYCDKIRCYQGYLDSKIGSRFLKMLLKTFKDKEEWVITSNNAGAVFNGIGMYKNMKFGKMFVTLNTSREEVKSGEIIPILDGTFSLKRFVITDMPFVVRLISFHSMLTKLITKKDYVVFDDMNGNLSYKNNLMAISNVLADGMHFDLTMDGTIDTKTQIIKLKGHVIPSFGFSMVIKKLPILDKVFSGVQRKGIFVPYSIEQKY